MNGPQTTQDNANLAQDAYRDRQKTRADETVDVGGVKYKVLEHVSLKNGYAGTIYQRADNDQIIVAHRGTEDVRHDGLTDAAMVVARTNDQLKDAYALTDKAIEFARRGEQKAHHKIEITTIGHSLGGTLAQACAYKYAKDGLKGEAFNPYGAANLGLHVPTGGHDFHNHVMATDSVSSAARHYGDVTVYAKPDDIKRLETAGYANTKWDVLHGTTNALAVAATSFGAHGIGNFANIDDKGRPQPTVLTQDAQDLAQKNAVSIQHYRDDVYSARSKLHFLTDPNPIEKVKGAIEDLKNGMKPDAAPRAMLNDSDRPIFDRIRGGVPEQVADPYILKATADLRTAGLNNAASIAGVTLHNDAIFVTSDHTAGFAHSKTAVNGATPDPGQSIEQISQANQQQQQNLAFQQQQQHSRPMSLGHG
ncbi:DUF6792 domain-containing protein [Solilutibacter silvestris]|uniref:DUF6792 domain-containing protein n=1 Tax=Solilutibacter silvestris TaxID=1645665 RepID=UPI003D32C4E7